MDRLLGSLRSLRPWQVAVLIVALVGAGVATFAVYLSVTSTDSVELTEDQQIVPVQRGDLVNQISISGTLSLPSREVLRFGSEGVVDEVLIEEGQRVAEGDVLARLDEDTIASLDKGVVQARVDLRDAQDALEDYLEPAVSELELARAEQQVANAELALRLATESLEDLVNPADLLVTEANAKVASARLALENAQEALDELLEPPTDLERAQAQAKVASARLALENAQEAFDELLEPPTDLERAQAQAKVASARLALGERPRSVRRAVGAADRSRTGTGTGESRQRPNHAPNGRRCAGGCCWNPQQTTGSPRSRPISQPERSQPKTPGTRSKISGLASQTMTWQTPASPLRPP